jgi:hypothetical protein
MPPKVSKRANRKVGDRREFPLSNTGKANDEPEHSDDEVDEDENSVQADGRDKDDRVWVQCNTCDRFVCRLGHLRSASATMPLKLDVVDGELYPAS